MNVLPWLVLHGAAVWQVSLALFVLGGLAFAWIRPRITARRAARAARSQLGWPVAVSDTRKETRVTLSGRLEVTEAPCLRHDGAGAAAVSGVGTTGRAGRLLLHAGDANVRLDGPIEILAGSHEARPGRALRGPSAIGIEGVVPVFRALASGDRVRVSGVLGEEASDEAPSYRDAPKRWTLGGGLVAAFEGAPRVRGPAALVRVPPALAGGLLFLAVFGAGGEIAMGLASKELVTYASAPEGGSLGAVLVAAATPFRRADALGALVRALDARSDPDPAALAARAALHEMRGEPVQAAAMWIAHGEPERGAALAEREQSFALAARGWYAAGEFERAAEAWERSGAAHDEDDLRFGLGVHLFARRLDRAAHAARLLAAALRAHPADNDRLRAWYATRAVTVACLADALDARRGDGEAWKALHADHPAGRPRAPGDEPPGPLLPACAVLRVDLFDGSERLQAIRALPALADDAHEVPREWLSLLAAEADAGDATETAAPFQSAAEVLAIPNGDALARAVPAVERHLAEMPAAERPRLRAVGHRMMIHEGHRRCVPMWAAIRTPEHAGASAAMFALLAGDDPAAKALALQTGGGVEPCTTEVAAVTALPGDPRPAEQLVARSRGEFLHGLLDFVVERDAATLLLALSRTPPPDEDEKRAWAFAAAGDGAALARWLRRPLSQPGTFLRLGAPLLRTGRDEVARWVRWGHRPPSGFRPTEEVVHLANLAAAAESLAPGEGAEALRGRTARFRQAILRRETAIPLAVLERL